MSPQTLKVPCSPIGCLADPRSTTAAPSAWEGRRDVRDARQKAGSWAGRIRARVMEATGRGTLSPPSVTGWSGWRVLPKGWRPDHSPMLDTGVMRMRSRSVPAASHRRMTRERSKVAAAWGESQQVSSAQ